MKNFYYLTTLKVSLEIIFSISLFGEGKFILLTKKIVIKDNIKNTTIYLMTFFNLPGACIFFKFHITFNNFKLRHICDFSIKKHMKSKKNLVLLGMMGSGKSTIGNLLSKKLDINFVDIDSLIEKLTKMTISQIFLKKGEKYFRDLEEKITMKSLSSTNTVISLGGGVFMNETIRAEVIKNHFSFWLNLDTPTLLNRIKKSKKRPIVLKLNDCDEL